MSYRLGDWTATVDADHQRQAFILSGLVKHILGPAAIEDPAMLSDFLRSRGVSGAVTRLVKAAVAPVDLASGLAAARPQASAFLAAVDRVAVLPRLGAVKVPDLNVAGATQTTSAAAYWVGEQVAKPLSALAYAAYSMRALKLAAQVAATSELMKIANADTLMLIERALVSATAAAMDDAFVDPANAGTANVKPASVTNNIAPIVGSGSLDNQIGQALNALSGGSPTRPTLVVSLQTALRLTTLRDLEAVGVRVIVTPSAGNRLIGLDPDGIAYVGGDAELKIGEPDIEMVDNPAAYPGTSSTVLVSSWQRNQKVVRAERATNWKARPGAVSLINLS
jgi:hypothetical protein